MLAEPLAITRDMGIGEILRRRAREHPDQLALITGEVTLTYGELDRGSEAVARGLRSLGLEPGDRIAVLLPNDWTLMITWLACAKGSYLMVPINAAFGASEMTVLDEGSRPRAIVTTPERADARTVFGRSGAKIIIAGSGAGEGSRVDGRLEVLDGPAVELEAPADTLVTMLFTSGSTGRPKGVVHDHLFWNSYAEVGYAEPFGFGPHTRYLSVMPLFHINGLGFGWSVLYHGGTLVQQERFSASRFWEWAREIDANATFIIGAMANMLLSRPPSPDDRDHGLRVISTSALVPEKLKEFERRFDSVLLSCYGMTEGGGCTERPDRRRLGSSGVVNSGTELQTTAEDGTVCPPGVAGRIEMRDIAGGLAVGYWDLDRGGVAEPIRSAGWFKTSDFGIVDEDGFLFFEARERDRLRRAGENISAVEIENVLRSHPAVQEAAVVGVPDPVVDEEVKAFVQLVEPGAASHEELVAYAGERLAKFKQPRYWEFVDDMPRTPTERVKKHELSRSVGGAVVDLRAGERGS
jgi:crotonobetaine/carnitine-CoA ligase